MKCCNKVCRKDSCLGSACDSRFRARDTCGWHRGRRLDCCSGQCEISCQDRTCFDKQDCGGWSKNGMKCCDGVCQKSCFGSPCFEHGDCQSRELDCCGFFENKTCQRSCLNHGCSLSEVKECGRRPGLFCCGDGTCRKSCLNSICFTETFRYLLFYPFRRFRY